MQLKGKVAIVTGASRGIGNSIAHAFCRAGAAVVLSSRKQADLDRAAAELKQQGYEVRAWAAHTGDQKAVEALMQKTIDTYGGIDILVNNAGTNPHFGPLLAAEDSHWDKTFDVNVKGYVRTVRAAVGSLKSRGGGSIINIASIAGRRALPGMGVYAVTKAGVESLTRTLALELAEFGIRVNAIAPGIVQTRFSTALWQDEQTARRNLSLIPQGRFGQPDEIAGAALYLASDASSFTTGATLVVDGGQTV